MFSWPLAIMPDIINAVSYPFPISQAGNEDFMTAARAPENRTILWLGLALAGAGLAAWANAFGAPFIFDDRQGIVFNPHVRSLWPLWRVFQTPLADGSSVTGRPLSQFSFALNFAVSGLSVWSYHALNLAIHIAAALAFFGVARRTMLSPRAGACFKKDATGLAFFCALLWMLHPLQTESVTYIVQRSESLAGMWAFTALYCAIRGWESPSSPRAWHLAALLCFACGIGSKEVIVVLPCVIFLYDLVFVHPKARQALFSSRLLYAGLIAQWAVQALVVYCSGTGKARTGPLPYSGFEYALTQAGVLFHYLRTAAWPDALSLDYSGWRAARWEDVYGRALLIAAALGATMAALRRGRPAGFAAAWFFLFLAPTSSILPLADMAFEHRMYMPLAGLCALAVLGAYRALDMASRKMGLAPEAKTRLKIFAAVVGVAVALALGGATHARNAVYQDEAALWMDAAAKQPPSRVSFRPYNNAGYALLAAGRPREAVILLRQAQALFPQSPVIENNLCLALAQSGQNSEALACYGRLFNARPDFLGIYPALGDQAILYFQKLLQRDPQNPYILSDLGYLLAQTGRLAHAMACLDRALSIKPDLVSTWLAKGDTLKAMGKNRQARQAYAQAGRLAGK